MNDPVKAQITPKGVIAYGYGKNGFNPLGILRINRIHKRLVGFLKDDYAITVRDNELVWVKIK